MDTCRPKPAEGKEDFLFEFEALARGKEGKEAANGGGLHMTADTTYAPAALPPAAGGEESGLLVGVVRGESSGDGYAPDSKALLARVHRCVLKAPPCMCRPALCAHTCMAA